MSIIRKKLMSYFGLATLFAIIGFPFFIQALWIPEARQYKSSDKEVFFIQKTSSKDPCFQLSSNIKGDFMRLNGAFPSDNLCHHFPMNTTVQLSSVQVIERLFENEILSIEIGDPFFDRVYVQSTRGEWKSFKINMYLIFVLLFPLFFMFIGSIYRLFVRN